jgi:ATP-dependent RNA helicase DOB1
LVSSIVILMLDEKMEPAVAKGMLQGEADSLDSAFHLTYNLLLSQMRCQDSTPEDLLQRSYKQFQADRALPDLQVGGRGFWIQDASGVGKVD